MAISGKIIKDNSTNAATVPVYLKNDGLLTDVSAVAIAHGGTGATTAAAARSNLGVPSWTYVQYSSANDLVSGTSALTTGQLYLLYR